MRQKLFTVEDNFYFTGREGTIVVGRPDRGLYSFIPGDEVILIQLDGKETKAKISGIEITRPFNSELIGVWFKTLTKNNLPIGTEVFIEI